MVMVVVLGVEWILGSNALVWVVFLFICSAGRMLVWFVLQQTLCPDSDPDYDDDIDTSCSQLPRPPR